MDSGRLVGVVLGRLGANGLCCIVGGLGRRAGDALGCFGDRFGALSGRLLDLFDRFAERVP